MMISPAQIQGIVKAQNKFFKKTDSISPTDTNNNSDVLTISVEAKTFGSVKEVVLKSPEIRADKINNLKNMIDSGSYSLSADEIATKMLSRSFADEVAWR